MAVGMAVEVAVKVGVGVGVGMGVGVGVPVGARVGVGVGARVGVGGGAGVAVGESAEAQVWEPQTALGRVKLLQRSYQPSSPPAIATDPTPLRSTFFVNGCLPAQKLLQETYCATIGSKTRSGDASSSVKQWLIGSGCAIS